MAVTIVRYRTRPERADENQALIEQVFAELRATAPAGLRYASFRLAVNFPKPGMYRVLNDFYPKGGTPQLNANTLLVSGGGFDTPPPSGGA